MSIKQKILDDTKTAMKDRDADKVSALRLMTSAIKNREIDARPEILTEQDIVGVIKKLAKQRKDSIEQFEQAGRTDLVEKEQKELVIIEMYLPSQMDEAQIKKVVEACIAELGASSIKDMGKVMQAVTVKTQGSADNKIVSQIVKSQLQ